MKAKKFLIITCLIWAFSLLNGTGLGAAYHTAEYFRYAIYALVMVPVLFQNFHLVNRYYFFVFTGMTAVFLGSSLIQGHGFVGLDYLSAFILVAFMAKIPVTDRGFRLTGIVYACLGMAILLIYNFGGVLSGWNPNSIAMIGLMSYTVFAASYFYTDKRKDKYILFAVTLLFFLQTIPLNSRSCLMVMMLMFVIILFGRKSEKFLANVHMLRVILIIPLLVAIVVTLFAQTDLFVRLNEISLTNFGKTLSTGRERIWQHGFQILFENFFFGNGRIESGYWHNSAVSCLASYGVVGYTLWTLSFYILLCKGRSYEKDPQVAGCLTVFLLIFIQQSFEIGFFMPTPTYLMYVPLGLMLGRIKYLKMRAEAEPQEAMK